MDLKIFILTAIILLIVDILFITYFFSAHYNVLIKQVQKTSMEVNLFSSVFTYVLLVFGLYYFIIRDERSVLDAVILGTTIYGVFAGTNYSLLKNWSLKVALIDTVWGGVLFGITTLAMQYIKGVYIRK
tara:strand:+ start:1217 stop:1603 length:387 start_codon:yes stop_codon:yes gene_type:complete